MHVDPLNIRFGYGSIITRMGVMEYPDLGFSSRVGVAEISYAIKPGESGVEVSEDVPLNDPFVVLQFKNAKAIDSFIESLKWLRNAVEDNYASHS